MMAFLATHPKLPNLIGERSMPDLKDHITTEEAAQALGFHVDHIRRMRRQGDLIGRRVGQMWFISKKSIEEYKKRTFGLGKFDPRRGQK